jgi:hypothetical protein
VCRVEKSSNEHQVIKRFDINAEEIALQRRRIIDPTKEFHSNSRRGGAVRLRRKLQHRSGSE